MILTVLLIVALVHWATALTLGLCSTENSASDFTPVSNQYMSNGYCSDTCQSQGYSYAVVQRFECWCTNSLPSSSSASSNCDTGCPGYPQEKCASEGYYGYIDLLDPDSTIAFTPGTLATSSATTTSLSTSSLASVQRTSSSASTPGSSSPDSSSSTAASVAASVAASSADGLLEPAAATPSSHSSADDVIASATGDSSAASGSLGAPTTTVAPTTIYSTKTVDGTPTQIVRTEYVTTVPTQASAALSSHEAGESESAKSSFFDSAGKVAGTFTAVGVVVVGLVLGVLYCCCCGRRPADHDDYTDEENQYSSDDSLNVSTPKTQANSLQRDNSSKSLFSMLTKERDVGGVSRNLSKKRLNPKNDLTEMPMFPISEVDTRLDTFFLNANQSAQTFGDEQDYSRKLKITNPDAAA